MQAETKVAPTGNPKEAQTTEVDNHATATFAEVRMHKEFTEITTHSSFLLDY